MPNRLTRTLLASTTITADGNGTAITGLGDWDYATFILDVTAAAQDYDDWLNVRIQSSFDGTNWYDICAFPQVSGSGGTKTYRMRVSAQQGSSDDNFVEHVDGALAAGAATACFSPDKLRVDYDITDTSGSQSHTASVTAYLEY